MEVFVKICGITRLEDAEAALDSGADAIGFVAYPPSSRYVSPEKIAEILRALRGHHASFRAVGVFVDPTLETLREHVDAGIDVIQLHGGESSELAIKAAELAEVWKALKPASTVELEPFIGFPADKFLLDAFHERLHGGTGLRVAAELAEAAVALLEAPVILAGGLTPENVEEAVAEVKPFGVDVSGGVESSPGVKNPILVKEFILGAKRAENTI